jgi:hypothetical protein
MACPFTSKVDNNKKGYQNLLKGNSSADVRIRDYH